MRAFLLLLMAMAAVGAPPAGAQGLAFEHEVIDPANPSDPHCKTLGDINGDGFPDALAASSSGDGMYWYEYPDWTKHAIRGSGSWTTDMQTADIDGDGDPDVIIPNSSGLQWYENPRPVTRAPIPGSSTSSGRRGPTTMMSRSRISRVTMISMS